MLGKVWPERNVAFPDFLDPQGKTQNWWISEFSRFHDQVAFDGAWIDMNEPSNFGTTSKALNGKDNVPALKCPMSGADSYYDNPPYETQAAMYYGNDGHLYSKTLCMLGTMGRNSTVLYDSKNIYGWSESVSTHQAIQNATGKRGIVISRSTFPSSGKYTGHWLGDNTARWQDLQTSVIGAQEFNMFGIPYVGSDICGFIGNTNEELCLRWQQMGAFHSFSRNHNDKGNPPQDPAQWPTVAKAARRANLFRYHYLPYLYTLHFKASLYGGTVVRPVFFEFPNDDNAHKISYQFLWGPSMMIIPVVEEGTTTVQAYLPKAATWYSIFDSYYGTVVGSGNTFLLAGWDSMIPIFLRGGSILPRQAPALTTVLARKNRFELVMGLINDERGNKVANGELFWDDGDSIYPEDLSKHNFYHFNFNFKATSKNASLVITQTQAATGLQLPYLENIEIFGYPYTPDFSTATVNGKPANIASSSTYAQFTKSANITGTRLIDLNSGGPTWTFTFSNK
jgi:alpha-glucosidase (family GH31 glycosyl hydrolase)